MEKLYTPLGEALLDSNNGIPWEDYPRPQMVRRDWLCLNGSWDFTWPGGKAAIRVPFCPESLLSGLGEAMDCGKVTTYRRTFTVPQAWTGKRVLLHFGAVMRECRVYVNDMIVAQHDNGYLPFSADITGVLNPERNSLTVSVINDLSHKHPWGKQSKKRGGMWYTPCSGIWQTVWLEPVPEEYLSSLSVETGADWAEITAGGVSNGVVSFNGKEYPLSGGKARITVENPILWSPDNPHLYPFSVLAGEDRVESYFALRTLTIEERDGVKRLCLNGKPYFFNGVLDQGYWSDGLFTPASPDGFENDILAMKSLGFNMLRKHIKIEPERFYYDCDRLGMVVFQDMVNCGEYSYLRDTVLPTVLHGSQFPRRNDHSTHRDTETRQIFLAAMRDTVTHLKNHPSICLWTIFNEGWGQFNADDAYDTLKALDPSRFIDATSGWFHQSKSDVDSLHLYFEALHLGKEALAQFLSEYGGWTCQVEGHVSNLEKIYGYKKFSDRESFASALREMLEKELLPLVRDGLSAAVYTQLSDIEDETNGFLTYDRKVLKIDPSELKDTMDALARAVPR